MFLRLINLVVQLLSFFLQGDHLPDQGSGSVYAENTTVQTVMIASEVAPSLGTVIIIIAGPLFICFRRSILHPVHGNLIDVMDPFFSEIHGGVDKEIQDIIVIL